MIELIYGDCLEHLDYLYKVGAKALITDPQYGIGLKTNYKDRRRGKLAECNNFAPIVGDDRPFDPSPWLHNFSVVVLFGANYYADKLPISGGWIVWDKLNGLESKRTWGFADNSDCELIWTNVGNAARILRHRWMGALKESERNQRRVHPTQKPIALMQRIIEHFTEPGDLVIDPYMGSGTTGIACAQTQRNFIGVEISAHNFDLSVGRVSAAAQEAGREELKICR